MSHLLPRCAHCHFPSPATPCDVCASGVPVHHVSPQEVAEQQAALLTSPVAPLAPVRAPRVRQTVPAAEAPEQPGQPCGRCGLVMRWTLGRARVIARGSRVFCDACKGLRQKEVQAAYHRAHYKGKTAQETQR